MQFFADVPPHQFHLFGSRGRNIRGGKPDSDLDVALVVDGDAYHPYFQSVLESFRPHSLEHGGCLDLFVGQKGGQRLDNAYDPKRALDAGPGTKFHEEFLASGTPVDVIAVSRCVKFLMAQGWQRAPVPQFDMDGPEM